MMNRRSVLLAASVIAAVAAIVWLAESETSSHSASVLRSVVSGSVGTPDVATENHSNGDSNLSVPLTSALRNGTATDPYGVEMPFSLPSSALASRLAITPEAFAELCASGNVVPPFTQRWGVEDGFISSYFTKGDHLLCTRGRQLFRFGANRSAARWLGAAGTMSVHIQSVTLEFFQDASVVWHPNIAVISTALLSMFHFLNDLMLPLHAALTHALGSVVGRTPLDLVLLYQDKQHRGHGSDAAALVLASTLVPNGSQLRPLIHPKVDDEDTTVHCYCAALLQPGTHLVSVGPESLIVDGDPKRRQATEFYKTALNERYKFLPYGTHPIPPSEWRGHGLWNEHTTADAAVRMLFVLRNKTRLIGKPELVAEEARKAGFAVHVMTPEHESVATQVRAARYADVIMGMHGQALTWMLMMDSGLSAVATGKNTTGAGSANCRAVVELLYYGRPLRRVHNVYEVLAADSALVYRRIPAVDATFNPKFVSSDVGEKRLLMRKPFPHTLRGFMHQTAFHNPVVVGATLRRVFERVSKCVVKQTPTEPTAGDRALSDTMMGGTPQRGKGRRH